MDNITLRETPLSFQSSLQSGSHERDMDNLDLLPYAEALRDFIHECETPMTIGVQGDWGIGKTSLLNMLRGAENEDRSGLLMKTRCKIINFDTWSYAQFNQEEYLSLSCLYALTKKISNALSDKISLDPSIKEKVGAASKLIGNVLKNVKVNVAGVSVDFSDSKEEKNDNLDFNDIAEQMIAFRSKFAEMIQLWVGDDESKRVVIFIDDLDRIKPIRAIELLEAIKTFADVPGCVFVFAVDYEVVQMGMVEKLGKDFQKTSGKSFFDKIIQLPFVMPSNNYKLDSYIMGLLKEAGFPYADKLSKEKESIQFFHDITICTVGRNPRSIKRVMNYANLLERIRKKYASRSTSSTDSKILYALICMQIAWPELFSHFTNNPTAETISNLENWEFLDSLPEAHKVFERTSDEEKVKNEISTYFDTLFGVLDKNDDGQIDNDEMEPVLNVMRLAKLTSTEAKERPRDFFVKSVIKNTAGDETTYPLWFLNNIFMKSVWFLGSDVQYRKSGSRYITIVRDRKQIGTLVSLKTNEFIFRLVRNPERIIAEFDKKILSELYLSDEPVGFIRTLSDKETNLTGYGDTIIDYHALHEQACKLTGAPEDPTESSEKILIKVLNELFKVIYKS